MAKVCHKGILNVRYFFIEILDNDHFFNGNGLGLNAINNALLFVSTTGGLKGSRKDENNPI